MISIRPNLRPEIRVSTKVSGQIKVTRWNEETFLNSEDRWEELLARSNADRLFLSWSWQSLWWQTFASNLNLELLLLGAHNAEQELVGIASLYMDTTKVRGRLTAKRVQFVGNCWRGPSTTRTEYLDFIARTDIQSDVASAFLCYLRQMPP